MASQTRLPRKLQSSGSIPKWSKLGNILRDNLESQGYEGVTWADVVLNNQISEEVKFQDYGFTLPADAQITGIEVKKNIWALDESRPQGVPTGIKDYKVRLLKGGVESGDDKKKPDGWPNSSLGAYKVLDTFPVDEVEGLGYPEIGPAGEQWQNIWWEQKTYNIGTSTTLDRNTPYDYFFYIVSRADEVPLGSYGQGDYPLTVIESNASDIIISCSFVNIADSLDEFLMGIAFRYDDSIGVPTFWCVNLVYGDTKVEVWKYEYSYTTKTLYYTYSWTGNYKVGDTTFRGIIPWRISAEIIGTSLSVKVANMEEGEVASFSTTIDNFNINATKHGFRVTDYADNFSIRSGQRVFQTRTYGSSTDLWSLSLTPADVNSASFGVVLQEYNSEYTDQTAAFQAPEITVYYIQVFNEQGSGGAVVSGQAGITTVEYIDGQGGVLVGGLADVEDTYPGHGGILVGGLSDVEEIVIGTGGAVVSGQADITMIEFIDGSGGVVVAGAGKDLVRRDEVTGAGGEVVVYGSAAYKIDPYVTSGEVVVYGEAIVSATMDHELNLLWNVREYASSDLELLWNTGELDMYWYRVIGKKKSGAECPPYQGDECCQFFVVNIHARTPAEVCQKLKKRGFIWPIERVQRFSKPASNQLVSELEAAGEDFSCVDLEDVDICQIPDCTEFCIDAELVEAFSIDLEKVSIGIKPNDLGGEVIVYGTASADYSKPELFYTASGEVIVYGNASYISSGYSFTGSGGVIVQGSIGFATSSYWSFIGGQWPSVTGPRFSQSQDVIPQENSVTWLAKERVRHLDSSYVISDLSYENKSNILFAKNFAFDIPASNQILGAEVTVYRLASADGVRDLTISLGKDGVPVSNNLADLSNNWATSDEVKTYGNNGIEGKNPWTASTELDEPDLPAWSAADVNSSDFGVLLQVQNVSGSNNIVYAWLDYVTLTLYHEDPLHQIIRVFGVAPVVSPSWNYIGSGFIYVSGQVEVNKADLVFDNLGFGGVWVYGNAGLHLKYTGSGEVIVNGQAFYSASFVTEEGSGGCVVGGEADVQPYIETASGGVLVGGQAEKVDYFYDEATGGIRVNGSVFISEKYIHYDPSGGVIIGGSANPVAASYWSYTGSGSVYVGGKAELLSTALGTFVIKGELDILLADLSVDFPGDVHIGDAVGAVSEINKCKCDSVTPIILARHNLGENNVLEKFLYRNHYEFPKNIQLYYNDINQSWQYNLHMIGKSSEEEKQESWDILFELRCSDKFLAYDAEILHWVLSIQIWRKILGTDIDFDTHIHLSILPDNVCNVGDLSFVADINVLTQEVNMNPNAFIYHLVFYDNIGLFRTKQWVDYPHFVVAINENQLDNLPGRVDLTDSVLVN